MSITYCIRDFRFIGAPYLEALFAVLRAQPRPFYAFLAGLPKEGFLHFRFEAKPITILGIVVNG